MFGTKRLTLQDLFNASQVELSKAQIQRDKLSGELEDYKILYEQREMDRNTLILIMGYIVGLKSRLKDTLSEEHQCELTDIIIKPLQRITGYTP